MAHLPTRDAAALGDASSRALRHHHGGETTPARPRACGPAAEVRVSPFAARRAVLVAVGLLLALPTLENPLVLDDLLHQRSLREGSGRASEGANVSAVGSPALRPDEGDDADGATAGAAAAGAPSAAESPGLSGHRAAGRWARLGAVFTFASGRPAESAQRMDAGDLLPWWTDPRLKVSFFRPLSAASHALDAWLWPEHPARMQAHSLFLYGLLLAAVAGLYGAVAATRSLALLALALFVVDDTHGATMAWLANRNALLTTLFGVLTLWSHHRHRVRGWRAGAVMTPALLAIGFLAGEATVATMGYLVAHALFIEIEEDNGPARSGVGGARRWLRRLRPLWPSLAVVALWQIAYRLSGYGVEHSGVYRDPVHAPGAFLGALMRNGLTLGGAELGVTSADLLVWGGASLGRAAVIASIASLALLLALARPVLRDRARPQARFWATGALLAVVPVAASIPGDRLLLFVSVGAMAFLAELVAWHVARWRGPAGSPRGLPRGGWRHTATRAVVIALVARHSAFAVVLLPYRAQSLRPFARGADAADAAISRFGPAADTVVFVSAPFAPDAAYQPARWALAGRPHPPRVRWLSEGREGMRVTRIDARTLRLEPRGGFFGTTTEQLYRDATLPTPVGQTTRLAGMTATVVSHTPEARPAAVDFTFTVGLEDPRLLWLFWQDGAYQPFPMPGVGTSTTLAPAPSLLVTLAAAQSTAAAPSNRGTRRAGPRGARP